MIGCNLGAHCARKCIFVNFESLTPYSVALLPILLMYMLVALRVFERRKTLEGDGYSTLSIINVRDAALVTIALDISELLGAFEDSFMYDGSQLPFAVVVVALSLHVMAYFTLVRLQSSRDIRPSKSSTQNIFNMYVALTLLMTNAVTLMEIMQAMGKGL